MDTSKNRYVEFTETRLSTRGWQATEPFFNKRLYRISLEFAHDYEGCTRPIADRLVEKDSACIEIKRCKLFKRWRPSPDMVSVEYLSVTVVEFGHRIECSILEFFGALSLEAFESVRVNW